MFPLGSVHGVRRPGGAGPPNVNLGLPDILKTTIARKLDLKIPLDMVKYPLWVQKLLYYTIQHEGGRHIDFRQMSYLQGRLRLTAGRRRSACMSSRALATNTASNFNEVIYLTRVFAIRMHVLVWIFIYFLILWFLCALCTIS